MLGLFLLASASGVGRYYNAKTDKHCKRVAYTRLDSTTGCHSGDCIAWRLIDNYWVRNNYGLADKNDWKATYPDFLWDKNWQVHKSSYCTFKFIYDYSCYVEVPNKCVECDEGYVNNIHSECRKKRTCLYETDPGETSSFGSQGEYIVSTDRTCGVIPPGYYADGAQPNSKTIKLHSECTENYYMTVPGTQTTDTVCSPCVNAITIANHTGCVCLPGFEPLYGQSYPCTPCPAHTFKSDVGMHACQACNNTCIHYKQLCTPFQPAVCLVFEDSSYCEQGTDCLSGHCVENVCCEDRGNHPDCPCSARRNHNEFSNLMCSGKVGDACDSCMAQFLNQIFTLDGTDTTINPDLQFDDFRVSSVSFLEHETYRQETFIGKHVGIYEKELVSLAYKDKFTADLVYNGTETTLDVGLFERVQVDGPKLVWTAGTYDLETHEKTVRKNSLAWQRIQMTETRFAEISVVPASGGHRISIVDNNENTVAFADVAVTDQPTHAGIFSSFEETVTRWTSIKFTTDVSELCSTIDVATDCVTNDIYDDSSTALNLRNCPATCGKPFVLTKFQSWTLDENHGLSASSTIVRFPIECVDVTDGYSNTVLAVSADGNLFAFDDETFELLNTTALSASINTPSAPESVIAGCVLLGGSCSEDMLCCQDTHEYALYATPPEPTIANVVLHKSSVAPTIATLETQPIHFRIQKKLASDNDAYTLTLGTGEHVNCSYWNDRPCDAANHNISAADIEELRENCQQACFSRTSVSPSNALPVPTTRPAPMGVKAMGYNRPGGFEAFQALLSECGNADCEACQESQIVTNKGLAQTNATLRNKYVRGQTLPTDLSFLGTFFRSGHLNDKAALKTRGEDWGVLADDITCDREKRASGVVLGTDPTKCTTNTGEGYDGTKQAYHNRWYLNQETTPGTPLWPAGKHTFVIVLHFFKSAAKAMRIHSIAMRVQVRDQSLAFAARTATPRLVPTVTGGRRTLAKFRLTTEHSSRATKPTFLTNAARAKSFA